MQVLTALMLTGLVFKEYSENYNIAVKELEKLVKKIFDQDGFPLTRNPSDLIFFSKYLILCKKCIMEAQEYVPEFLDNIIVQNLTCLKSISSSNNQVPLFNGGSEENLRQFNELVKKLDFKIKSKKNIIGGIQKFKYKNIYVYFDIGAPPEKKFSQSYQSGPLSFEYYLDGEKIITNCGFGHNISSKAELLSRLTSAQSTLTLNDTSVTKFERNKLINRAFGNSIKNTFEISNLDFIENNDKVEASASHNGYEKNFGCIHKRTISINKFTSNLSGHDEIIKNANGKPVSYNLRFHLYPGLLAVKTIGGDSVLIQLSKKKSLIFKVNNETVLLERSIFLGTNKILDNTCVTVSGNLVNKNKKIHWEIKKDI